MIWTASSSPSILARGVRGPTPSACIPSSEEPPPRPRIRRPPESPCRVAAILATMAGERYGTPKTREATLILEVLAATHASRVQTSWVGVVPFGCSFAETKSYPSPSARMASATGSVPWPAAVERFTPNTRSVTFASPAARAPSGSSPGVREGRDRDVSDRAYRHCVQQGPDADGPAEHESCHQHRDLDHGPHHAK